MALRKGGEVRNARLSELRQAGGVALLHAVVEAHGGTDGRIRSLCTALLAALEAHGAAGATLPPERRAGLAESSRESANAESAERRGAAARRVAAAAAAARDARDNGEAQAAARQVARRQGAAAPATNQAGMYDEARDSADAMGDTNPNPNPTRWVRPYGSTWLGLGLGLGLANPNPNPNRCASTNPNPNPNPSPSPNPSPDPNQARP